MKRMLKMMTTVLALGGLMAIGGCGSDEANPLPPAPAQQTAVPATVAGQTATTTAPVNAVTAAGVPAVAIPINTAIVATGGTMPPAPAIVVTTPTNGGVGYVPPVVSGGTTLTLGSSSGAVDISIPGVTTFTVGGAGATVTIPVTNDSGLNAGAIVSVTAVKANGTTYKINGTVSGDKKTVTVNGVTNFCWYLINPDWLTPTGSTGSTGT